MLEAAFFITCRSAIIDYLSLMLRTSFHTVILVEGICRCFPDLVTDGTITSVLAKLAEQVHEEEAQCTAAEIFAGIIRGLTPLSPRCLLLIPLNHVVHVIDKLA